MISIEINEVIYNQALKHMQGFKVEQLGFFLAEYVAADRLFKVSEWLPISSAELEYQGAYHISLSDDKRAKIIKWASDNSSSIIEIHSHIGASAASFSASDMFGFSEWVPHIFWRLQSKPYAAIVISKNSFDSLAWIDSPTRPEQVESIKTGGGRVLVASELSIIGTSSNVNES